jgi:hypothetical protein
MTGRIVADPSASPLCCRSGRSSAVSILLLVLRCMQEFLPDVLCNRHA